MTILKHGGLLSNTRSMYALLVSVLVLEKRGVSEYLPLPAVYKLSEAANVSENTVTMAPNVTLWTVLGIILLKYNVLVSSNSNVFMYGFYNCLIINLLHT